MSQRTRITLAAHIAAIFTIAAGATALAGYKSRPWVLRSPEDYSAKLTSESVTIAVEPLYRDDLATQVFDVRDILTRGIMPLAVAIFNDNDFPVRIATESVELIVGEDHTHTRQPGEVVYRLFQKGSKNILSQPIPRQTGRERLNPEALKDFEQKFLEGKVIGPHGKGGGFLYFQVLNSKDIRVSLAGARLYIPDIYREDNGKKMMFFEIDIRPAFSDPPSK